MIAHVEHNKQLLICIAFVCFSLQTKAQSFTASEVVDSYLKACELMKRDSTGYADYKKSREILENILPYANDDIKKLLLSAKTSSLACTCMHAREGRSFSGQQYFLLFLSIDTLFPKSGECINFQSHGIDKLCHCRILGFHVF